MLLKLNAIEKLTSTDGKWQLSPVAYVLYLVLTGAI